MLNSTEARSHTRGMPLSDELKAELRQLVHAVGEREARSRVGVSRSTLARALAGLGLYPGTAALLHLRLEALRSTPL